jgi:hypothetical protein
MADIILFLRLYFELGGYVSYLMSLIGRRRLCICLERMGSSCQYQIFLFGYNYIN